MSRDEPIAIVGQGCVLPGAHSPGQLWSLIASGGSALGAVAPGRWSLPPETMIGRDVGGSHHAVGGYVRGFGPTFARWLAAQPGLDAARTGALDPVFRWTLYAAAQALGSLKGARAGAVIGNLSYPSAALSRLADALDRDLPIPPGAATDRFCSSGPGALMEEALGLSQGVLALDAACASSLYALKLACDRLRDGEADVMLAGAVSACDDLFIHVGFTALQALSPSGQSRPFHRDADGLIPGEGAAMVALMRLSDAAAAGAPVLAVVRGIGLSNDGRSKGLLAPSSDGQERAIRGALRRAGWAPEDVRYVECHATGTRLGDAVELRSMARVYGATPIGSLKGNLGHLITASGAAGVLKLIGAFTHGLLPPTLTGEGELTEALAETPFRVVAAAEPWTGPRRAALSAFGFGGNNAHLLLEAPAPTATTPAAAASAGAPPSGRIAVVGLGVRAGAGRSTAAFVDAATNAGWSGRPRRAETVVLPLSRLRIPPRDLQQALPQHTLLLEAALDLQPEVLGGERSGIFVGMECDPTGATLIQRSLRGDGLAVSAPAVLGMMPNVIANRLSSAFDLCGPGLVLSSGEASGLDALRVAARALRADELDLAIVGAVDLTSAGHALAAGGDCLPAGDAAVALLLMRPEEASRRGLPALAWLDSDDTVAEAALTPAALTPRLGHPGAAAGLLCAAAAVARCATGAARAPLRAEAHVGARPVHVTLRPPAAPPGVQTPPPLAPPLLEMSAHPAERAVALPRAPDAPDPLPESAVLSASVASPLAPPTALAPTAVAEVLAIQRAYSEAHQRAVAQILDAHRRLVAAQQQALAMLSAVRPTAAPEAPAKASPVWDPAAEHLPMPWGRAELLELASGRISAVFGPTFVQQDGFEVQVRMPEPPLLLADRITGLRARPGDLDGKGSIWSESDVEAGQFYVHCGRISPGMMIESGQADLLLISYMGVDFENRGLRRYRLLGCELTFHRSPAAVGQTMRFDIHCTGHARTGAVRLFFFASDCRVGGSLLMSVRRGQAGFFTLDELARTAGVLWRPEEDAPTDERRLDPPAFPEAGVARAFSAEQLRALAAGDALGCFGPGWELAGAHTRTPGIPSGQMQLLEEVEAFEPRGGPWGRGYLRAVDRLSPDDWFFDGHFKNDPCMPGTLMLDGGFQAMAFFVAAMGLTLGRDGWRFEPVTGQRVTLRCRGQATPASAKVTYEIFVRSLIAGDEPTLYADVLGTVDGVKAFHVRDVGLRLVPDWPLDALRPSLRDHQDPEPVAATREGHLLGLDAMLSCAWGQPSRAFGPMVGALDGPEGTLPRLPGPPYHFISRLTEVRGDPARFQPGAEVVAAYDIPDEAWYFAESGHGEMPFAVLLEAALQPCGWLAMYVVGGSGLLRPNLLFRNLDGSGTVHRAIRPGQGTLRTAVTLTRTARAGDTIIMGFDVRCTLDDAPVYTLETVFGFFPRAAFAQQVGLPPSAEERARFLAPSPAPARALSAAPLPGQAGPMLRRIETVDGFWPEGGAAGLGRLRARQAVDPRAWYFKAHFFQDPVQPGSLGLEAMLQAIQALMGMLGMTDDMTAPTFAPIGTGEVMTWTYRGQVVPTDGEVVVEVELTSRGVDHVVAEGALWVDDRRIYRARGLGMRVHDRGAGADAWLTAPSRPGAALRLFCLPPLGGSAVIYRSWIAETPDWLDVRAVRLPRDEGRGLEELLGSLADALASATGETPYALFGYSFGAILSGCLTLALRARGHRLPERILLGGCDAPVLDQSHALADLDDLEALMFPAVRATPSLRDAALAAMVADARLAREVYSWVVDAAPVPLPVITFYGDADHRTSAEGQARWGRWTTLPVRSHRLPGDHSGLLASDALLRAVLEALVPALRRE